MTQCAGKALLPHTNWVFSVSWENHVNWFSIMNNFFVKKAKCTFMNCELRGYRILLEKCTRLMPLWNKRFSQDSQLMKCDLFILQRCCYVKKINIFVNQSGQSNMDSRYNALYLFFFPGCSGWSTSRCQD